MKKPIIISYDCIEHDPIDTWIPHDVSDVDIPVNFMIGLDGKSGDNFLIRVVTPNNFAAKNAIVLNDYSWSNVFAEHGKYFRKLPWL